MIGLHCLVMQNQSRANKRVMNLLFTVAVVKRIKRTSSAANKIESEKIIL